MTRTTILPTCINKTYFISTTKIFLPRRNYLHNDGSVIHEVNSVENDEWIVVDEVENLLRSDTERRQNLPGKNSLTGAGQGERRRRRKRRKDREKGEREREKEKEKEKEREREREKRREKKREKERKKKKG